MSVLTLLWIILIIYLVSSLASWVPAPAFPGRNPLWVVLIVILVLVLLRGPLGWRW